MKPQQRSGSAPSPGLAARARDPLLAHQRHLTIVPQESPPTRRSSFPPADANPHGDIFGGWLLSQMDLAGGAAARRRAKGAHHDGGDHQPVTDPPEGSPRGEDNLVHQGTSYRCHR